MAYLVKITAGEGKGMYLDSCGMLCLKHEAYYCGSKQEATELVEMSRDIDLDDKPVLVRVKM